MRYACWLTPVSRRTVPGADTPTPKIASLGMLFSHKRTLAFSATSSKNCSGLRLPSVLRVWEAVTAPFRSLMVMQVSSGSMLMHSTKRY